MVTRKSKADNENRSKGVKADAASAARADTRAAAAVAAKEEDKSERPKKIVQLLPRAAPGEKHPQVKVNWYGSKIEVDAGIVDLLKLVWQEGFETSNSCQDNDGKVWIQFTHLRDYKQLVRDAAKYGRDLYDFLVQSSKNLNVAFRDDDDQEESDEEREIIRRRPLVWSVGLRFPKEERAIFARLWKSTYQRKHAAEAE